MHNHICQFCEARYPGNGITFAINDAGDLGCDCTCPDNTCPSCAAGELYSPLCQQCSEEGDYSLATEVVEGPMGFQPACVKHYEAAGEAGATMWRTEDVSASERQAAAYTLDGRLR